MRFSMSKTALLFLFALLVTASNVARAEGEIKPDADVRVLSQGPTALVFQVMAGDEPTTHTITAVNVCANDYHADAEWLLKIFGGVLPSLHDGVWEFEQSTWGFPPATMADTVLRNRSPANAAVVFAGLEGLERAISPCRYQHTARDGSITWIICRQGPKTVLLKCPNPPRELLYKSCGFFRDLIKPTDANSRGD